MGFSTPNDVGNPTGGFPVGMTDTEACENAAPITSDDLLIAAALAAEHTVDGQTVVERSLDELIKLDQYIAARRSNCRSNGNGWGALGTARVVPPDAAGRY